MRESLRVVVVALALVTATVPSTALAAKGGGGKPDRGGGPAPKPCVVPSHSYDALGAPGSGAANDPYFDRQWGLTQINAPAAWQRGATGAGVTIAVADTGVDLNHPDLAAKLVPGADFQAGKTDC